MRVLGLCLSSGVGGLELYVLRELQALQQRGHHCVAVTRRGGMLAQKFSTIEIDHRHLNPSNQRLPLISARQLAQIIDREKIDVIHVNWAKDLNLAALAKRFSVRKPSLLFTRHMELTRSKQGLFHRWFYQQIDQYLCVSKMVESQAKDYLGLADEKIKLLHLGVKAPSDLIPNRTEFYKQHGLRQAQLNIAVFGRIEEAKGQHVIVAAVKQLLADGFDISLTLIGHVVNQGYGNDLIEEIEADGLGASIKFVPFIENATDRMPCFDLIVLTTYKETFGLVLVEAMRAGVAVIGTAAGGVLDIIDDEKTGLLVKPQSVPALAKAIQGLYQDDEKRSYLAAQGKHKADYFFCETRHFDQLERLLINMVSG